MRIAIHAGTLRGAGSRAVGQGLVAALAAHADAHQFVTWLPREWPLPSQVVAGMQLFRTAPGLHRKAWLEGMVLPAVLRQARSQVLLSLGDTSATRPGIPHVLFVQQAFLAYRPADWGFDVSPRFRAKMAAMAAYFRAGLPRVSRFVVQTQDMKEHLADRWDIRLDRVDVIPSSVGADVLALRPTPRRETPQPTILYLSAPGPHKNHRVLPDVLRALRNDEARIAVTLAPGDSPELDRRAAELGVTHRLVYCGALPRTEALSRLASATVTVIPSKLESFGIGYYEALALGVPVIAANKGFSREACGSAARYADADDATTMAKHADDLLTSSVERDALSAAARARFDSVHVPWSVVAERYLSVLEAAT